MAVTEHSSKRKHPADKSERSKKRKHEDVSTDLPGDFEHEVKSELLQEHKPESKPEPSNEAQRKSNSNLTAKEKKAKRSEERHRKGKKRKHDDDAADLPGDVRDESQTQESSNPPAAGAGGEDVAVVKKKSKRRKKHKTSKDGAEGEDPTQAGGDGKAEGESKQRFIIFIGNLPFSATSASITEHFVKIRPDSVRHITDKSTQKSKGFAFLEFEGYDRMKTCLKLYHHSVFDDGISPGRKINVELTAGGGGSKSSARKTKLQEKNERLNEQRKRRAEEEAKVKAKAERKKHGAVKGEADEEKPGVATPPTRGDGQGIHPSRLARMGV
ncbi:hypothetical protein LTR04_007294 [Oleoguttula sp. CCFEE 6159]|nr:hypothetical protein LTR04_007294 [Oleoguttula sp. CCFEE 6159]